MLPPPLSGSFQIQITQEQGKGAGGDIPCPSLDFIIQRPDVSS